MSSGFAFLLSQNPLRAITRDMATTGNTKSTGNSVGALGFEATLWATADKLHGNLLESRTLAVLEDAVLPKLLSGELRVPTANMLLETKI